MTPVKHEPSADLSSRTMALRHWADNPDQVKATRIRLGHSWPTLFLAARGGGWCQPAHNASLQAHRGDCVLSIGWLQFIYVTREAEISLCVHAAFILPHVPTHTFMFMEAKRLQWISFSEQEALTWNDAFTTVPLRRPPSPLGSK